MTALLRCALPTLLRPWRLVAVWWGNRQRTRALVALCQEENKQ